MYGGGGGGDFVLRKFQQTKLWKLEFQLGTGRVKG